MRLFIAIELSSLITDEMDRVQERLKADFINDLRFTKPNNMHLTLKFLGDSLENKLPLILEQLQPRFAQIPCFSLALTEAGCFPERGGVRVVWAGVQESSGDLQRAWEQVEAACYELDYPTEKQSYVPHITLARIKRGSRPATLRESVTRLKLRPLRQKVGAIALIKSELQSEGAQHTILSSISLGK